MMELVADGAASMVALTSGSRGAVALVAGVEGASICLSSGLLQASNNARIGSQTSKSRKVRVTVDAHHFYMNRKQRHPRVAGAALLTQC